MKVVCWLAMGMPELAEAEVLTLLQAKTLERHGEVLVVEAEKPAEAKRLAFTRAVYEHWFTCPESKLWAQIDTFDWQKHVQGSLAINVHHGKVRNSQIADRIWHHLENPKANLKNPDNAISFFFVDNKVVCGRLLSSNRERFEERRADKVPAGHPTSCHPRLARALINLTGVPTGSKIIDPFCGAGGILVEAGLMGLRPVGYDINREMVDRARRNCEHAKVECDLDSRDATQLYAPEKYVVADLPFGRMSGKKTDEELVELYAGFLERLQELLRVRAVLAYPDNIDMKKIVKKTSLKPIKEFSHYVHGTLTRKIIVLEPGK
jgi:tRNA (guanine10-N2)-dimethyltransferase